jgi:Coenzyme PQQ synthesis protein D (PqqD)
MLLAISLKKVDAMQIELATMVKQSAEQVSCNLNGEIVILNLKSSLYFGLDDVGAYVWEAMGEPKKVSDLCKRVLERFNVGEEQCQADVIELIGRLDEAGLVEIVT